MWNVLLISLTNLSCRISLVISLLNVSSAVPSIFSIVSIVEGTMNGDRNSLTLFWGKPMLIWVSYIFLQVNSIVSTRVIHWWIKIWYPQRSYDFYWHSHLLVSNLKNVFDTSLYTGKKTLMCAIYKKSVFLKLQLNTNVASNILDDKFVRLVERTFCTANLTSIFSCHVYLSKVSVTRVAPVKAAILSVLPNYPTSEWVTISSGGFKTVRWNHSIILC